MCVHRCVSVLAMLEKDEDIGVDVMKKVEIS